MSDVVMAGVAIEPIRLPVSVAGRVRPVSGLRVGEHCLVINGSFVKVGKIFDAYWIEAAKLPDLSWLVQQLQSHPLRPDVLTFTQRVPDTDCKFDYPFEWDNV